MDIFIALEIVFLISLALLAQVYVFYPLSLRFLSLFTARQRESSIWTWGSDNYRISIIISAHNEEAVIEEKIKNTLALDWPKDKMEILIGDDGSTDRTAEIVAKFSEIRLVKKEKNEGKAAMLNDLCGMAKGDIFLFSDANSMLKSDALKNLAAEFADKKVGCACGQLVLKNGGEFSLSKVEEVYWKSESSLKELEGNFGAVMGSNGALYAIRSELFSELPTHKTVMDDFYITAKILMKNYSCVFCKNAHASEHTSTLEYGEFKRKIRIGRANFNFLFTYLPLLSPLHPMKAYMFLSHKLLRWFSPFLLIAVFFNSIFLAYTGHIFFKAFFALELLFILAALLGLRMCNYFLSMNFAIFLGFCKSFLKEKGGGWERVERQK
ncbi:MAG: glycosyltransferase family 2 protein [Fibromonadaceae bacterium]|jgi:cellulose synthase/poly-beta-1,6-N-acetylglucosamine synthase-like glycosyltransferase|nr:glycosyltransferase family 2 protein [Fibromonadaceae bacterium]